MSTNEFKTESEHLSPVYLRFIFYLTSIFKIIKSRDDAIKIIDVAVGFTFILRLFIIVASFIRPEIIINHIYIYGVSIAMFYFANGILLAFLFILWRWKSIIAAISLFLIFIVVTFSQLVVTNWIYDIKTVYLIVGILPEFISICLLARSIEATLRLHIKYSAYNGNNRTKTKWLKKEIIILILLIIFAGYIGISQNSEDEDFLLRIIEFNPKHAEPYNDLGIIYFYKQEYSKAIKYFSRAIEISPDYYEAYLNLGNSFYIKKQYNKAIANYSNAIKHKPDYAEAFYRRADIYHVTKQYEKAIVDYSNAIKHKPDYAEAFIRRGKIYYLTGQLEKAIADYNNAINYKPDYVKAYYELGLTYYIKMQYKKAIDNYSSAIKHKPDYAEAFYGRGLAYNATNQYDKAIADYSNVIKYKPDHAKAYYEQAHTYYKTNHYKKAISNLTKAIEIDPNCIDCKEKIERCNRKIKQKLQ